jgi:hypothetical protein
VIGLGDLSMKNQTVEAIAVIMFFVIVSMIIKTVVDRLTGYTASPRGSFIHDFLEVTSGVLFVVLLRFMGWW